jgi:very-short-patch-repair endonuclease
MVVLIGGWRISVDPGASVDSRIRAIAGRQSGRVSRDQLLAAAIKPSAIDRRLRNGGLERVFRAVFALPNTADLPLAVETAAVLACGAATVLSHHSAATLWHLRPGVARPVHVTIPGKRGCPAPAGVKVHRSITLTPADVRVYEGLPITSPARTLLDVAATLTERDVERLLDEARFALRIVSLAEVRDVLARAGGHPGRARLERVANNFTRSTRTESPPEEKLLAMIRAAGLPEPRLQVSLLDYRIDFFWPDLRLAVEVDAYGTHGSPARFEADRRRDARLLSEKGIVVLRVTKLAVETRPFEVIALVARAIAQREVAR